MLTHWVVVLPKLSQYNVKLLVEENCLYGVLLKKNNVVTELHCEYCQGKKKPLLKEISPELTTMTDSNLFHHAVESHVNTLKLYDAVIDYIIKLNLDLFH